MKWLLVASAHDRRGRTGSDALGGHVLVASSYPFADAMWTMFVFFVWIAWFMLLFRILGDIFSRHDIGGGAKNLWIIFVIVLPFFGGFVYLFAQKDAMKPRAQGTGEEQKGQRGGNAEEGAPPGG